METVNTVTIGHLTLDDVVLPNGETHFDTPGGAALYAAGGVFLWEDKVGLVSRIGKDYEQKNINYLKELGLNLVGAKKVNKPNIHIWALYDRNENRYFIPQKDGGKYEELAPTPKEIPEQYKKEAAGFHIAPMPLICQEKVLNALPEDKIITVDPHHEWVDSEYKTRWENILKKVNVFLPSEEEFMIFWEIEKKDNLHDYKTYLKQTSNLGPEYVVLKVGSRGVVFYDRYKDEFHHIPSIADKIVDVTGAGDAFCGGFLSGIIQKGDPYKAAMRGIVASSIVLEDFGVMHLLEADNKLVKKRKEKLKQILG